MFLCTEKEEKVLNFNKCLFIKYILAKYLLNICLFDIQESLFLFNYCIIFYLVNIYLAYLIYIP